MKVTLTRKELIAKIAELEARQEVGDEMCGGWGNHHLIPEDVVCLIFGGKVENVNVAISDIKKKIKPAIWEEVRSPFKAKGLTS
jgi:hypothetical protein